MEKIGEVWAQMEQNLKILDFWLKKIFSKIFKFFNVFLLEITDFDHFEWFLTENVLKISVFEPKLAEH